MICSLIHCDWTASEGMGWRIVLKGDSHLLPAWPHFWGGQFPTAPHHLKVCHRRMGNNCRRCVAWKALNGSRHGNHLAICYRRYTVSEHRTECIDFALLWHAARRRTSSSIMLSAKRGDFDWGTNPEGLPPYVPDLGPKLPPPLRNRQILFRYFSA